MDGLIIIVCTLVGVSIFAGLVIGVLKWNVRAGATTAVLTPFIMVAGFAVWAVLVPLEYGHALWGRGLIVWNYLGPFVLLLGALAALVCLISLISMVLNRRYGRFALLLAVLIAAAAFAIHENSTFPSHLATQAKTPVSAPCPPGMSAWNGHFCEASFPTAPRGPQDCPTEKPRWNFHSNSCW